MPLKKRFVDGHILDAHDALQPLHFDNGVNEQKRMAVRQYLLNFRDVQYHRCSHRRTHRRPLAFPANLQLYAKGAVADETLRR
jgi:hypothetical protein